MERSKELAANAVNACGLHLEPVEQRPLRHAVVRQLVVRRHAALVSPPNFGATPVGLASRRFRVGERRRAASGEDDASTLARRTCEPLGYQCRCFLLVCDDDELDVAHDSPAASSFERSIAAWMALRNAARTPACSSS